jgi:hypothetical protein
MRKLVIVCLFLAALSYGSQRIVVAEEFTRVGG